ncbi:MAG: hypothetical protein ACFFCO_02765 [Promethearchaeota archaeon]
MSEKEEKPREYGTDWVEPPDLITIGGKWVYAVGLVKDRYSDSLRLRIAKGKVKGYTKRSEEGVLEAFPEDPLDPVTQPNRLNIKTVQEWQDILKVVEKWLPKIPGSRPTPQPRTKESDEPAPPP